MRLKSYTNFPPGGFAYRQPETGWQSPFGLDWDTTIKAISEHRKANPRFNLSTDLDQIANELEQYTCSRIKNMSGAKEYILGDLTQSVPFLQAPLQVGQRIESVAVVAIDKARNAHAGVAALLDWLGSGATPVNQELATERAKTCSVCPLNQKGDLFQRLEAKAGEMLRKQLEIRNEMNLRTDYDYKLATCLGCDCYLQLKVHVPMDDIRDRTRKEVWDRLDLKCWMLKEK